MFEYFYNRDLGLGVNWFTADWLENLGYTSHIAKIVGYPKLKGKGAIHADYTLTLLIQDAEHCPEAVIWPDGREEPELDYLISLYDDQEYSDHLGSTGGYHNSFVKIDETHFIIAYQGLYDRGVIKTFEISNNNTFAEFDYLIFDYDDGDYHSIVKIDETHFILAYQGSMGDGYIKTFSIDSDYKITQIAYLEHDTDSCKYNSIVKIDNNHFALAYINPNAATGYIKTFSIDASYNISQIDSLVYDVSVTYTTTFNSMVLIDNNHLSLAYDNDATGYIKTFSIDASYNISQIDSLVHDTNGSTHNSLILLDSTHLALAYADSNSYDGYIKTFSIDASYNISQIDSLYHQAAARYNSLVKIDDAHVILAYAGPSDISSAWMSKGCIATFLIDSDYKIIQIDMVEHDLDHNAYFNSLVRINVSHYVLVYASAGYIKPILIT